MKSREAKTPTISRNVTSDGNSQWLTPSRPLARQQVPRAQSDDADQHGEGVVIDVAGLQPARLARELAGGGGDAVRAEAVDDHAVAALPQPVAQGEGGAHEQAVIKLVEIPFVEQKQVDRAEPRGQPARDAGFERIE